MPNPPKPWGTICAGTRLEKLVASDFLITWSRLIKKGMRKGDAFCFEHGKMAHAAGNSLVRQFLASPCDTLFILDSDADIDQDFLNRFRDFEMGWQYDALQAFHVRRGWPPEPIWFTEDEQGNKLQCMVLSEGTSDVAMIGTHCALFRREIFERIYAEFGKGIEMENFDWFCYPRHKPQSDEVQISTEARQLGFRLGATTAVKAGHLSQLITGWDTYQEYLEFSGTNRRTALLEDLAALVSEFTGEPAKDILRKALNGPQIADAAWHNVERTTPDQVRGYYGKDTEYLYKILYWNAGPVYEQITQPLQEAQDCRVLVIGAGLGQEVIQLMDKNRVDIFELPGLLKDFCRWRFRDNPAVSFLEGDTLVAARDHSAPAYNLVVAIDVLEHIHPDEFAPTMETMADAILPGGTLYCHNNFKEPGHPEHFDHAEAFDAWAKKYGFEQVSEYEYKKN